MSKLKTLDRNSDRCHGEFLSLPKDEPVRQAHRDIRTGTLLHGCGRALVVLFLWQPAYAAHAQLDTGLVRYRPGFDFAEGIYLGIDEFRANAPALPLAVLKDAKGHALPDLMGVGGEVYVTDSTGTLVRVDLGRAWGACSNNTIYIRAGDGLFRIGMLGALCHVLYERSYQDWSMAGFYGPMSPMGGPVTRTVQEQRVLDLETGRLLPLTGDGLDPVLARDLVLYEEWTAIPPKKRKEEVLFQFMRRYNDRHPVLFPPTR